MRVNSFFTVTAGTPINLAVQLGLVANNAALALANPILANRIDAQMAVGATVGVGYYMDLAALKPGTIANTGTAGHLGMELGPATATVPGPIYVDAPAGVAMGSARDLTKIWIDVSATGAAVLLSADLKV